MPEEDRAKIRMAANAWIRTKKPGLEVADHYFLHSSHLSGMIGELLEKSTREVLAVNPFVEKIDLVRILGDIAGKKGVKVILITRNPEKQKYTKKDQKEENKADLFALQEKGVKIFFSARIHAKLIIADRGAAVVSSMNFVSDSVAGKSWEAGMLSTSSAFVADASDAFFEMQGEATSL